MPEEESLDEASPKVAAEQGLKDAVAAYASVFLPSVQFDSVEIEQVQPSTIGKDGGGELTSILAKFKLI